MSKQLNYKKKLQELNKKPGRIEKIPKDDSSPLEQTVILKYVRGKPTNLSKFTKWVGPKCVEKYGYLGKLIESGVMPTVDALEDPDNAELDPVNDPHGFSKARHMAKIKRKVDKEEQLVENMPLMFNFIYTHISEESKERLSLVQDWDLIYEEKDVLRLWLNIGLTHSGIGYHKLVRDRRGTRKYYDASRQRRGENILDFKQRYEDAVQAYENAMETDIPQDQLAADFVDKLDDARFGQFKVELENDLDKGIEYPQTLEVAYRRASRYKTLYTKLDGTESSEAMFAAAVTKHPKSGKLQGKRSNAEHEQSKQSSHKQKEGQKVMKAKKHTDEKPKAPKDGKGCWICQGPHFASEALKMTLHSTNPREYRRKSLKVEKATKTVKQQEAVVGRNTKSMLQLQRRPMTQIPMIKRQCTTLASC